MSKGTITNTRASVLARLKNLSKLRRLDYQHILLRYATGVSFIACPFPAMQTTLS